MNEAHGRAFNYAFDSMGVVELDDVGGSHFSVNNRSSARATLCGCVVSFGIEEDRIRAGGFGFLYLRAGSLRYHDWIRTVSSISFCRKKH